ncbi:Peroxisomal membrane signal receptor PTS1 [Nowakowskiella sp. JEL0078]|nr:Peroxisomal membrane signal receptor PTS1 [Nowakowskiella sp. JEL0078]
MPQTDILELQEQVTKLYLDAARNGPDSRLDYADAISQNSIVGNVDADVQVGLGVLFYNRNEFDKAVDCFVAALTVRPQDYLLWNRLGATLANSGKSEQAIEAYYKSLDIKPNYVRGRYNLGVSCINIGCYKEAAEHLLAALAMQDSENATSTTSAANVSQNLWDTLRRAFLMMERRDLADKSLSRKVGDFRGEFDY